MGRASKYLLTLLFIWNISATGINSITLNGSEQFIVSQLEQNVLLVGNIESAGNRLVCYFYVDVDNNQNIDTHDLLIDFFVLKDGVGWIKDDNSVSGNIRGDENHEPGIINTTLFTKNILPPSSQNWIVKAVDEDKSEALAFLRWNVNSNQASVTGKIICPNPSPQDYIIYASRENYFIDKKVSLANNQSVFNLNLGAGYWHIFAQSVVDPLQQSGHYEIKIDDTDKQNINLLVPEKHISNMEYFEPEQFKENWSTKEYTLTKSNLLLDQSNSQTNKSVATISGTVLLNSETPAKNIDIVAVNENYKQLDTYIFTKTNSSGKFSVTTDIEGEWKIGVYSSLFKATPAIQFLYITNGNNCSGLKYNLTLNTEQIMLGTRSGSPSLSLVFSPPRFFTRKQSVAKTLALLK